MLTAMFGGSDLTLFLFNGLWLFRSISKREQLHILLLFVSVMSLRNFLFYFLNPKESSVVPLKKYKKIKTLFLYNCVSLLLCTYTYGFIMSWSVWTHLVPNYILQLSFIKSVVAYFMIKIVKLWLLPTKSWLHYGRMTLKIETK